MSTRRWLYALAVALLALIVASPSATADFGFASTVTSGPVAPASRAPAGDASSYIRWTLSEAAGSTSVGNHVVGGSAVPLTVNTIIGHGGNATLGTAGLYADCTIFAPTTYTSGDNGPIYGSDTVSPPGTAISIYGWVRLDTNAGAYQWIAGKQYDDGNWGIPNNGAWRIYGTNNVDGTWLVVVRPVGLAEQVVTIGAPHQLVPGVWHLIGFTYDGTTVTVYMDGDAVTAVAIAAGAAIDWSGNGPWGFGGVPHLGTQVGPGDDLNGKLSDWWVDTVVRPTSWFKAIYLNGIGLTY